MLTTSRSACRPASSGPRGPRSGEVGIALLVVVRAGPGLLASSVSGIGSTWGRPRSVDGSTALITARTDGRRCKGGVSAAGEAPRCSSSCVALLSEKGETEAEPTNGTRERERGKRSNVDWAFYSEELDTQTEKPKTKTGSSLEKGGGVTLSGRYRSDLTTFNTLGCSYQAHFLVEEN